ncbi:MAG: tRNA (adenosine(37)-N6)-threonylcarbamoyltransferase complex ATPase subunit type 1 TsaE [Candidatus Omnitrophota bacterium]|jgi:tRNA threonylcarbamoyladenosine biosynthesis protein TsaE
MRLFSNSVKDTLKIGGAIAENAKKGDIICLSGTLGSGKTVLTKGIAAGLKVSSKDVISPSFVLLREYVSAKLPLYHFDLYRLKGPKDILDIGYEEYLFAQGLAVIEWADRLKYLKPEEFLGINLSVKGASKRELIFKAHGRRHKELLKKINEDISA